ncbi:MAG: hypothetical protein F4018_10185 [Acidobacteria bacterium]|nr:hypothetical protein [Acidobacteriota bacterium]
MLARQGVLIRASNTQSDAHSALHDLAVAAHVTANRAVLDVLGRAARALSTAAERLNGDRFPGTRDDDDVFRAVARAERAARVAADPDVSQDGNRTDDTLDELIAAARETLAALEQRVQGLAAGAVL